MNIIFRFGLLLVLAGTTYTGQSQVDSVVVKQQVDSLLKISIDLINQQNFDGALRNQSQVEQIVVNNLGKETALYGLICHLNGVIAQYSYEFYESEKWYKEAIDIRLKTLGKEHTKSISSMHNLAYLYASFGKYEKAEELFLEIKNITENAWGKEHPDYVNNLLHLGNLYGSISNFEKCEQYYLEYKEILEKTSNTNNLDYTGCLFNLATIYSKIGNFEKAEPIFLYIKDDWEKALGVENPNFALCLNNLGNVYFELGSYKQAESLFLESKEIRGKILGKEHKEFAQSLNNLAALYYKTGDLEKAEPILIEAINIREKALGKEHPDYASSLFNLGAVYHELGLYEKALPLYDLAKTVREQSLGPENQEYAQSLSNLAVLYKDMGNYENAELLELQSLNIRKKVFGGMHFDYLESLSNLSQIYICTGNYDKIDSLQNELSRINQILLRKALNYLSEYELGNYLTKFSKGINQSMSFAQLTKNKKSLNYCYDNSLFYKELMLHTSSRIKRLAERDSTSKAKYNLLQLHGRWLALEYSKPIAQRDSIRVMELEEKVNALEKDLTRSVAGYTDILKQTSWKEIQTSLPVANAAVEFIHYNIFNNRITDSTMYAALILLPQDTAPYFIPLFEEKQLQTLLDKTGGSAQLSTNLYAAARSGELLDTTPAYGTELYNLIWRPIDSLLNAASLGGGRGTAVKKVYFSPSGLLHRVAFAALPVGGKKVLSDRYALHQLGSTRSLVVKTPEPVAQNYTAAVFGGVQYERATTLPAGSTAPENSDNRLWMLIDRPRGGEEGGFDYLPGTQHEARRLEKLLAQNRVRVQTHTGEQATEEMLKALGRDTVTSPDILHIATHGFFFPDPEKRLADDFLDENAFKWNENPLLRSGLALAGANEAWSGRSTPGNIEDGIATAYEISHLNLSNTKLAVLSACQTGLGDIKGSEGVYGLQRAFKMAGVDYLLVSLWQVPDRETAEFMEAFYSAWLGGKTIHEAFAKAQKKMRKKYKEVYKWGAWVLVE